MNNNTNNKYLQSKIKIIYSDKTAEENRDKYKSEYQKYKELHEEDTHKIEAVKNNNEQE